MERFSQLFRELEMTNSTNAKTAALAQYFRDAPDDDKVWTIALLSHRRPRRTVNTRLLREWAAEYAGIPAWLFEESYHIVGDLAETIALVVKNREARHARSLSELILAMKALREAEEAEKKAFVLEAWETMDFNSRFLFNKLITGGLRVGVSQKIMLNALAKATGKEAESLAHRIAGKWDPGEMSFHDLVYSESLLDDRSKPYPFFLAYPVEGTPAELGPREAWIIEKKWDGIRGQLISREGHIFLWSRGEELITNSFPEFLALAEVLPAGIVLDGEILVWKGDRPGTFNELQKRLGRKKPGKKSLSQYPAVMMVYDLLELEGKDLRKKPTRVRRERLEEVFEQIGRNAELLLLSERIRLADWEKVTELWKRSRQMHCEGFMLKHIDAPYLVGRKKGYWWKWKVDPFTVDAVMLYAQSGHGRRANLFTDYTFAVWDGDQLVPFTKAYSGLTDEEFLEITRWVRKNTVERFGPVRAVTPQLVFEIAFEGIAPSNRHKSGVALRFPRMKRWRRDKHPKEANTLEDLKGLMGEG